MKADTTRLRRTSLFRVVIIGTSSIRKAVHHRGAACEAAALPFTADVK
jgi:hypothetical protein